MFVKVHVGIDLTVPLTTVARHGTGGEQVEQPDRPDKPRSKAPLMDYDGFSGSERRLEWWSGGEGWWRRGIEMRIEMSVLIRLLVIS